MAEFFPFFVILLAAVFFSEIFRRLHLPWVVALILAGVALGPHGVEMVELNETIRFLGQVGLVFLMFMAGLETRLPRKEGGGRARIITLGVIASIVSFGSGFALLWGLGFPINTAIVVGVAFVSSSIAVIIPSLESLSLMNHRLGYLIVPSTVMQDILSLILLSIVMHLSEPVTDMPLPIFYVLLFLLLVLLRWLVPRVESLFAHSYAYDRDPFQQELRVVLVMLLGTVIVFELAGLHPIIGGFFAGLILSDTVRSEQFKEKLRAISYGVFIPLFFVVLGIRTDLEAFIKSADALMLTVAILGVSLSAKFVSGWIGGRLIGEPNHHAAVVGAAMMPQLSTTLAVVTSGLELGIIPPNLATGLIVLSVVSTVASPFLVRLLARTIDTS